VSRNVINVHPLRKPLPGYRPLRRPAPWTGPPAGRCVL
jgi:hypothetical protein